MDEHSEGKLPAVPISEAYTLKLTDCLNEPRGQELIALYKENYRIPPEANISEEMILHHWEVEKQLRRELLASTTDNRWEVFDQSYSRLYAEMSWLNEASQVGSESSDEYWTTWVELIGKPPKKIYEIGSGKGALVRRLADEGFDCKATEITRERGEKWTEHRDGIVWGVSDGIHLEQFEETQSYDVALSSQVVEHMHPEDLVHHLHGVLSILKSGGCYIFSTPHPHTGPHDISKVFRCGQARGMHLKEYRYKELANALNAAGFRNPSALLQIPGKVQQLLGRQINASFSSRFLSYQCFLEATIGAFPTQELRRRAAHAAKWLRFMPDILMVGYKP